MSLLDAKLAEKALAATGQALARRGFNGPASIVLTGGMAALLAGWFGARSTSADCDVLRRDADPAWEAIEVAAREAATELDLPPTWLNRDASNYLWCLPLGWEGRCETVGRFGPLHVRRVSRIDLIAAKVVSSALRPQDIDDLRDLSPTDKEWEFAVANLDRLQSEDLDGKVYEIERDIVNELRGAQ